MYHLTRYIGPTFNTAFPNCFSPWHPPADRNFSAASRHASRTNPLTLLSVHYRSTPFPDEFRCYLNSLNTENWPDAPASYIIPGPKKGYL